MASATPARAFTVIQVASAIAAEPVATPPSAKATQASSSPALASKPVLLMLGFLLYAVYSLLTVSSTPTASEPLVWMVCLPYAVVMIQKLLTTIRSMESEETPVETGSVGQEDLEGQQDDCEFGSDASHDAIAVVGDVCVYVVVILLLCYVILPWQVRAGQVTL